MLDLKSQKITESVEKKLAEGNFVCVIGKQFRAISSVHRFHLYIGLTKGCNVMVVK